MAGTNYPTTIDDNSSLPNPNANDPEANTNPLLAHNYQHDTENDAIKAIETKLGMGASTPTGSGAVLYSSVSGASTWGNLTVGGDLAGSLPNPIVPGLAGKQPLLVSGTNLKTVNGISLLGSGDIEIAGGGTASPLTTKGDLFTYSTLNARLPVGSDSYILTADSTQATGLKWTSPPTSAVWGSITGTLSSQTDLQTALNAKQGTLTLTTTGTSGAATLTGNTLNIPNYATGGGGTGTVTSVSVVSANGFAGSVATATTTPAITLTTSITGLLKGNGTAISAATSGTDYSAGTSALATGILKSTTTTGALSIAVAADFPTLNQSTTGSAATLTTGRTIQTNLASTAAATFNGSANITPGVTGTLPVLNGGTGTTTSTGAGSVVLNGSPTLTGTPSLAAAVATSLNVSGQITSTQAAGTAPLVVTSTTNVANLNADMVDGIHANATATANQLLPLDANAKFPTTLIGEVFAHITNGSSQSLPATSGTTLTFPTVVRNNGMTVSSTTITVPTDGVYSITVNVQLDSNNIRADLTLTNANATASISQAFGKLSAHIDQFLTAGTALSATLTNNNGAANTIGATFTVARLMS